MSGTAESSCAVPAKPQSSRIARTLGWLGRTGRRLLYLPLRPFLPEGYFLRRELERIDRIFAQHLEMAKDREEREELLSERSYEIEEIHELLDQIDTRKTLRAAIRYGIPRPPLPDFGEHENDNWERSQREQNSFHLKPEGHYHLWKLIRQERSERRDLLLGWLIPVLTGLTGLVGALSGLAAWFLK